MNLQESTGFLDSEAGSTLKGKIEKESAKDSCCPSLTLKQRFIGFIVCWTLGLFISFLSFGALFVIVSGEMWRFAVPYTLGTILSLAGSFFLTGPLKQLKQMFHKKRIIVTIVLLSSIVATLVVAFAF